MFHAHLYKRLSALLLALLLLVSLLPTAVAAAKNAVIDPQEIVDYLDQYGKLPDNFITKKQAQNMGWDNTKNYVSDVAPGCSIGGDKFGNREKLLPEAKNRQYYEADVWYVSGKRTGERLVYSNDGLYFYTPDGYKTFQQLYPSEDDDDPDAPIIEPQAIADYIFANGKLPPNFITKREAQAMGWDSSFNYVSDVAPGYSIGGDKFGNYEGLLPTKKGRQYYEADCYYTKGKRNAYRIIYSNDGLVYYTEDHYTTFIEMKPSKK